MPVGPEASTIIDSLIGYDGTRNPQLLFDLAMVVGRIGDQPPASRPNRVRRFNAPARVLGRAISNCIRTSEFHALRVQNAGAEITQDRNVATWKIRNHKVPIVLHLDLMRCRPRMLCNLIQYWRADAWTTSVPYAKLPYDDALDLVCAVLI